MGARSGLGSTLAVLGMLLTACAGGAPATGGPPAAPAASATRPSAAAAASPAAAAPTTAPRAVMTIKVATTPSISNGARYIAMERGYFREEGIELEEVPSDTSAQTLPALAAGQVEIVGGGISAALFNAILQGIPVRLVLDQWTAYPGNGAGGLIVRKDLVDSSQVRDFPDLRGMKVGITAHGQATEYGLGVGLARAGLALTDVDTTLMSYPDMTVALGNRNIDAAVTIEPYGELAVAQGFASRFKPWPELVPMDNPAMVMFSAEFADSRNEAARRYAKAHVRGLRAYDQARTKGVDRDEIVGYFIKNTPVKDRALYDTMPWPSNNPDGRVNAETIGMALDWFVERGYVTTKVDLSRVIDNQFADYAVAQLGPYQP